MFENLIGQAIGIKKKASAFFLVHFYSTVQYQMCGEKTKMLCGSCKKFKVLFIMIKV